MTNPQAASTSNSGLHRFVHLNIYAGNRTPFKAINKALGYRPVSAGFNEAYPFLSLLGHELQYRMFHGHDSIDGRRGAKDNPILSLADIEHLGQSCHFGCDKSTPEKIAPRRWITEVRFEHKGVRFAHFNIHPNAMVSDADANRVDRANKYSIMMERLDRHLGRAEQDGFLPVVTGDMNVTPGSKIHNGLTAYDVFRDRKYKFESHKIDGIAFDRRLKLNHFEIISKESTGSDHEGFCATLES